MKRGNKPCSVFFYAVQPPTEILLFQEKNIAINVPNSCYLRKKRGKNRECL